MNRVHRNCAMGMLALLMGTGAAQAAEIEVSDARLRLLPGDLPGAGYFVLHNNSDDIVTLSGAESAAFESVEMHVSMEQDGMAKMHSIDGVDVPAGEQFAFAPSGHHLMFMQRTQSLSVGDEVEVVLDFEGEESLSVSFEVVSPVSQ